MAEPAIPKPGSALSWIRPLLPMVLGQLFALWLLLSSQSTFFQIMLMSSAEIWMVMVTTMIFFSRSLGVFAKRAGIQLAYTGALFVVLAFMLITAIPLAHDSDDQPVFSMAALANATLTHSFVTNGLVYLGITLGASLVTAVMSRDAGRWWYANMILPVGVTLLAMVLTSFVAFFIAWRFMGSDMQRLVVATVLFLLFGAMRLGFTWIVMSRTTAKEIEEGYAKFASEGQ